jgi:AraC-like DNA-binding protein
MWMCEVERQYSAFRHGAPSQIARHTVARIAGLIPLPSTDAEKAIAVRLLKVIALEASCRDVRAGVSSHAEAFRHLEQMIGAIGRGDIETIGARLDERLPIKPSEATAVRIRQFITDNSTVSLTLASIARSVGCSVRTATSSFRAYYQMSIYEFVVRRRLLHAMRLLIDTDLKLAAVALLVGFRDKASLHRHCLKLLSVTPMALRDRSVTIDFVVARLAISSNHP